MTDIGGRRPPKPRGEGAGLNVFRGNNADSFGRKHTHHKRGQGEASEFFDNPGGAGGRSA